MPGRGGMQRTPGYMQQGYGMGYQMQGPNDRSKRRIDFSRLHRDNFGYYNICFQKPDEKFNIQEAKAEFEEFGKVAVVHCAAKTVFIRFEERDAAEAALLAFIDTDKYERLSIPNDSQRSSSSGGGDEYKVILRNLSQNITEEEVRNMAKDYNPSKVSLQVKEDKTEAKVLIATEEKAKEFVETLQGTEIVGIVAAPRKNKVEPMGYSDDAYYYDAAGNYLEPLESEPRVVEVWVGNYPKETTQEELDGWFKKYGGTTYATMKEKKDKNWGFAFVGVKSVNQAYRAIRDLHQKKVGTHNLGVRLSQSEQMANPAQQDYDGYGAYMGGGDGNGYANEMQKYEDNIIQLRRNTKLQRASHLARGAEFMLAEVLDDCSHCSQIQNMMTELCAVLDSVLPPGTASPSQADMQSLMGGGGGSPRKPHVQPLLGGSPKQPHGKASPRGGGGGGGGMQREVGPEQGLSLQEQLNQLNPGRSKQPGSYPHGGHGQGQGRHPKHGMYR